MAQKTLYVTDLDGTLLTKNAEVTPYTVDVINRLYEKGILFTYATARAYTSASAIMSRNTPNVPAVVYNGTFIVDAVTGDRLSVKSMTKDESDYVLKVFADHGVSPIAYSIIDGVEKYSYCYDALPEATKRFLDARKGDARENPTTPDLLGVGDVFHFTSLCDGAVLSEIKKIIEGELPTELFMDPYFHEMFLEIHPKGATKAEGILELKKMLGCDRVVCFGDGRNDIPMFRIADECYAVENAVPELKEIATAVIGDNEHDGVAKWLENLL